MSCSGSEASSYCAGAAGGGGGGSGGELKLYQAFIFSVPVFFTFLFLLLFYLFYLKRRGATWQNVRLRASRTSAARDPRLAPPPPGVGIKKEVREMLPVLVFRESFLIRETQCSVCLGDYKADERLKRIPPCGHTFHVDCIDHWLTTHSTCPLCRVSLLQATKASIDNLSHQTDQTSTETQQLQEQSPASQPDTRAVQQDDTAREGETGSSTHELECPRREAEESRQNEEGSEVVIDIQSNVSAEDNAGL